MLKQYLLLVFGVFACSTAVIMIKLSTMNDSLLAASRQFTAVVLLLPLFIRQWQLHTPHMTAAQLWRQTSLPGLLLGLHFASWVLGARLTLAANGTLIVCMVPAVMPFLMHGFCGEKITRREVVGTILALSGVVILAASDYHLDAEHFRGDAICFASMLLLAFYLMLARRNRQAGSSVWLYVTPVYLIGSLTCLAVTLLAPLVSGSPEGAVQAWASVFSSMKHGREWLWVVLLAAVPTLMGHTIFNHAMSVLRGQVVALFGLGQFIFAGMMAFAVWGQPEAPSPQFYPAAMLVISGCAWAVLKK